tara:strand:- start:33433 stop:34740 length:1308 start_codon:yes stop_codon:yes gene_type:complete
MTALRDIKQYDTTQDTEIEWLGDIPAHWQLKKLKFVVQIVKRIAGREGLDVLSITQKGIKVKDVESGDGQLAMDYSKYQFLYKGEFAMNHMDLLTGYVDISKYDGVISPDYRVFRNCSSDVLDAYLLLIFQLGYTQRIFYKYGQGVSFLGRWRFPAGNFNSFFIPIPSLDEQQTIVDFVSRKTELIDEAITNKENQITLLTERKEIVIQNAVTRGIDSNVEMKDSGSDWIGLIPRGWRILPLTKYSTRVDYRGKTPEKVDEGRFLLTAKNVKDGKIDYEVSKEYIVEKQYEKVMSRGRPAIDDLLFTTEAPLGSTALVDDPTVAIAQRLIKFRLRKDIFIPEFVNSYMQTPLFQDNLQRLGTGSTALGIKASKLFMLKIITPPLDVQKKIVLKISKERQQIDKVIESHVAQIEKMKEYRETLIHSAVTGKIKVAE